MPLIRGRTGEPLQRATAAREAKPTDEWRDSTPRNHPVTKQRSSELSQQGEKRHQEQGENPMRMRTTILSALALLLCGAATASAATATTTHPTDTLILSAAQRRAVWKDLNKHAINQKAANFEATIGTFLPSTVKMMPIPSKVVAVASSLRPYDFAKVDHKLVIVDPSNKVIANVLTR
jgi:hypothetical protein